MSPYMFLAVLCLCLVQVEAVPRMLWGTPLNSTGPASGPLKKHLLTEKQALHYGARCLDGSPAGYYLQPSSGGSNGNKWAVFLEGGGYCPNQQTCEDRAKTDLGSSQHWPESQSAGDIMADTKESNPDMWDWNHVYIPYCGGDTHAGITPNATARSWNLYFAGHLIIKGIFAELIQHHKLNKATDLVLGGSSAGGIGVFNNLDVVNDMLKEYGTKVVGFPNAGWFLMLDTYQNKTENITQHLEYLSQHYDAYKIPKCVQEEPTNPGCASIAPVIFKYITTPMLIVEAQYDTNQLYGQDGVPHGDNSSEVVEYVEMFGKTMRDTMKDVRHMFSASCYLHHVDWQAVTIQDTNAQTAFGNWYFGRQGPTRLEDNCGLLPCNPSCTTSASASASISGCGLSLSRYCGGTHAHSCLACAELHRLELESMYCTVPQVEDFCMH